MPLTPRLRGGRALLAAGGLAAALAAEPPPPPAPDAMPLLRVAVGIIESTRWPGPPRALALCLATAGPFGNDLATAVASLPDRVRPLRPRSVPTNTVPPSDCDVLVLGGWHEAVARAVLAELGTRPVLTIGMGARSCDDGAQFCLLPNATGSATSLRFGVNGEALSRSGLAVNPRMLQLARPRPAEPRS